MAVRRAEAPILAAVFLDLVGFGMIIADIQLRAESMVPRGWPVGFIVGGLLASTFVTQLLVSPRWGVASDHRGRKVVAVTCTFISAGAMLTYALAGNVWILLLSRILSGFGAANVAVAQAYIADLYGDDQRTAALGRIGAAISTGLVVGAPLGGFLAVAGGNHLVGGVAGCASAVGALSMLFGLPNVPPKEVRRPGKQPTFDLRLLREFPDLRRLALIAVVAWFSLATLEGTFARLISHLYHYDQREFGILFGYESVLGIAVQGLLLAWIASRIRAGRLLQVGYLAQGLGLALNPFAGMLAFAVSPIAFLFLASTLYAVGSGVANPTLNSLCSRLAPESRQGELFGFLQGARSIGFVVGPMVGGCLFDWRPGAPYLLAGAVCVGAALLVPK